MLEFAMTYAGMGWHVFPVWWIDDDGACACGDSECASPGKHPIPARGCYAATTDAKIICGWWRHYADANIGLHCGPSGIVAFDLDTYKDVYLPDEVDKLISPEDEQTVTNLTPSPGVHLLYSTTVTYGNSRKSLPPGIDVRAWGAYIVLPPSNHEAGISYQWEADYGPGEIEMLPLPPKLKAILDSIVAEQKRSRERAKDRPVEVAPELETLQDALSFIPNWSINEREGGLEYRDWLSVLMAVHSLYPDQLGIDLIESWSPGQEGEVAAKFASFHSDGVTLGTLDYLAREHGWAGSFTEHYDGFSADHSVIIIDGPNSSIEEPEDDDTDSAYNGWPYKEEAGQIQLFERNKGKVGLKPVADFTATIAEEITDEHGEKIFILKGRGVRGGPFTVEITATEFGNTPRLRAALEAISPYDGTYQGMSEHLMPAIKKLTDSSTVVQRRRFNRTGWHGGRFLIPGRETAGVEIKLDDKAGGYDLGHKKGDMALAVEGLAALIDGIGPYGSAVIAHVLLPPLAALAGWRNDRYGLFLRGITGSMKTTAGRLAMALWGPRFAHEQLFEKMGGYSGTVNGIIGRAAEIADLPWMLDNFKPNTQGKESAVSMIHALMEGHTKSRQTRTGQNARTTPLLCWPLMTGEDIPGTDTAALARLYIIDLESRHGVVPSGIVRATELANHLHMIGSAWIDLLEGPRQEEIIEIAQNVFESARLQFAEYIREKSPQAENILRSATNFALNSATWAALAELEPISQFVTDHAGQHQQGILDLAGSIERHTADHLEANRFLEILAALMATGRVYVVPIGGERNGPHGIPTIGWYDGDSNICLYPDLAKQAVEMVDRDALNGMTKNSLYAQLKTLDALAVYGGDGKSTVPSRDPVTRKLSRVLVIKSDVLSEEEALVTAEEIGL